MQGISIYLLSALVSVSETAVDRVNKQGNYLESTLHAVYGLLWGQLWGEKQGKSAVYPWLNKVKYSLKLMIHFMYSSRNLTKRKLIGRPQD
jgi:hypothetical protein